MREGYINSGPPALLDQPPAGRPAHVLVAAHPVVAVGVERVEDGGPAAPLAAGNVPVVVGIQAAELVVARAGVARGEVLVAAQHVVPVVVAAVELEGVRP